MVKITHTYSSPHIHTSVLPDFKLFFFFIERISIDGSFYAMENQFSIKKDNKKWGTRNKYVSIRGKGEKAFNGKWLSSKYVGRVGDSMW